MYIIINQIQTLLFVILGIIAAAIVIGAFCVSQLKRKQQAIVNNTLVSITKKIDRPSYLATFNDCQYQLYSRNTLLQDFDPSLRKLEHIPSGKVSKMFINGRGSWRLTQGNILTSDYLQSAIQRENKQCL